MRATNATIIHIHTVTVSKSNRLNWVIAILRSRSNAFAIGNYNYELH
jgi:hypothetical protein